MHFTGHWLTRTSRAANIKNMNYVVFSCGNFGLASIIQTTLKKDLFTKMPVVFFKYFWCKDFFSV